MTTRTDYACEAATALSTSYTTLTLDGDAEPLARAVPDDCHLGWLHGEISSIADSAASITWYVSLDAAGDIPITDEVTETIVTGKTTATDGGVATVLDIPYTETASSTTGKLYVQAKTDTGTCNLTARLFWEV